MVKELYAPLVTSLLTEGTGMMGTVLLCETLLSLLPSMSTKDMPYHLLREYNITPIDSGVIAKERHLSLSRFASIVGDVLHIPRPKIHRVFVPLRHFPAEGRRQVIRMIGLLQELQSGDGGSLARKCAGILFEQFIEELLCSGIVERKALLMSPKQLAAGGCIVHSVISAAEYVRRTFDAALLPQTNRLRDFLKTSHDLCGQQLLPALAVELLSKVSFVPRVIVHEKILNISATSYHVLSEKSLSQITSKAQQKSLSEIDCCPLLKSIEATLISSSSLHD